jgi:poly-gamma-glutamate synthesis protein (capsule biosynthesis protein)
MDFGRRGWEDTIAACQDAGLKTVGSGSNLVSAAIPTILRLGDRRFAIIGSAEHEWSIAGRDRPGANPLDVPDLLEMIRELRAEVYAVIVLVHGGAENYPLPYPKLQHWCRHLIRSGASAVVCQHSHCMGAWENYRGALICYGQGNLMFPPTRRPLESWKTGYLIRLSWDQDDRLSWQFIPYRLDDHDWTPRRLDKAAERSLLRSLDALSSTLAEPEKLERAWQDHAMEDEGEYLAVLFGGNRAIVGLNRRWPIIGGWFGRKKSNLLLNMLRCEAHLEKYLAILDRRRS